MIQTSAKKKKKKIPHRSKSVAMELIPSRPTFEPARVNPNYASIQVGRMAGSVSGQRLNLRL